MGQRFAALRHGTCCGLVPEGSLSERFVLTGAVVHVFIALFQRLVGLPPVPRLLTIASVATARFAMWPAVSVLVQPLEGTLIAHS